MFGGEDDQVCVGGDLVCYGVWIEIWIIYEDKIFCVDFFIEFVNIVEWCGFVFGDCVE